MNKPRKCPKCKFCGYRFRYAHIHDVELTFDDIDQYRCENCNAVFTRRNPDNPDRGYKVVNRPDRGFKNLKRPKKKAKR